MKPNVLHIYRHEGTVMYDHLADFCGVVKTRSLVVYRWCTTSTLMGALVVTNFHVLLHLEETVIAERSEATNLDDGS